VEDVVVVGVAVPVGLLLWGGSWRVNLTLE